MMSTASSISSFSTDASFVEYKQKTLGVLATLFDGLGFKTSNIGYLSKGVYNTVFHFDLEHPENSPSTVPCVIRIANEYSPEEADLTGTPSQNYKQLVNLSRERTFASAVTLRHIHSYIANTPELLHVDPTTDNVLQRPYTIQSRLPGQPLDHVWKDLDLAAKCQIAAQVAEFNMKAETVAFHGWGVLGPASKELCSSVEAQELRPFVVNSSDDIAEECRRSLVDGQTPDSETANADGTEQKTAQDAEDEDLDHVEDAELKARELEIYQKLERVLAQMTSHSELGHFFSDSLNASHFKHTDPHMGNIIVDSANDSSGQASYRIGIIDLDSSYALPTILSRGPPAFLWQNGIHDEAYHLAWDGNVDHTPRQFRDVRDENGEDIKDFHDQYVMDKLTKEHGVEAAQKWHEYTYGRGTWVRRLVDLSLIGVKGDIGRMEAAEELIEEWEEKTQLETLLPADETQDSCKTGLEASDAASGTDRKTPGTDLDVNEILPVACACDYGPSAVPREKKISVFRKLGQFVLSIFSAR